MDLGVLHEGHHHPPNRSRNGPARQRRREKRAAARLAEAEEAEAALSVEEREVLEMAGEAGPKSPVKGMKEAVVEKFKDDNQIATKTSATEVLDEVCSD